MFLQTRLFADKTKHTTRQDTGKNCLNLFAQFNFIIRLLLKNEILAIKKMNLSLPLHFFVK